ncbi:MAG: 23S rRNA (uracil(1939)-C(5))-methyltransferase RlmD [Clostridia bacterium]|nr:23S rRNA (uracil(1939)-C(5))-methyltransferase RlmD [Clostridia bacterium]
MSKLTEYNDTNERIPTMLPCPYAKKCGGCSLQNLPYEEQLHLKQAKLIKLLGRYSHVDEIIGMEDPTHYRNKIQAAFRSQSGKVVSGVYQSASRRIVEVESCMLEDECAAPILGTIRKLCVNFKIRPFDLQTGQGFLRHVLIRRGFSSGQIMVVLVTAKGEFKQAGSMTNELIRRHPEITTVVWNTNPTDTPLFLGNESHVLFGEGYITDRLCGLEFRISPRSFYQVNPVQTEILYGKAREFAALTGKETVIDAYCGTGTIGLIMASGAKEVIGVEVNRDAVADAAENAKRNCIANATFTAADAGDFMSEMAERGESADVVITDPPRAGCSGRFLRSLLSLAPARVVYVSCNPETLARDLYTLTKGGYKVRKIQPVDMFPWTGHVETVVLLSRSLNSYF